MRICEAELVRFFALLARELDTLRLSFATLSGVHSSRAHPRRYSMIKLLLGVPSRRGDAI